MRLYELLNAGQTPPNPDTGGPMASPAPAAQSQTPAMAGNQPMQAGPGAPQAAAPQQPPMQTAGLLDTAKNFMMTPHPIGGAAAAQRPMVQPGANAAGQPPAVDRAVNSTFIGNINRGLQQGQQ